MRKIIIGIFSLFLFGLCHAQSATEDQSCEELKSDSYGYFLSNAQVMINREFNVAELSEVMNSESSDKKKEYTVGLTSANWNPSFTYKLKAFKKENGTICAVPNVDLSLELKELVIFIAKDIEKESCVDKSVIEHELKHVELYRKYGSVMVQNLNTGLKNILDGVIFEGGTGKELFDKIDVFIINYLKEAFEREVEKSNQEHLEQIDTEDEQIRQSDMCQGAAQKILSKY